MQLVDANHVITRYMLCAFNYMRTSRSTDGTVLINYLILTETVLTLASNTKNQQNEIRVPN